MLTSSSSTACRIGPFELDLRSGDLSKKGRRIRLQEKPRSILIALAEHPGEIVSRTELRERLWPQDTFVDFEDGLNTAMRKLREVLGDDPQSPQFIETIRGRGYRLLAHVEPLHSEVTAPLQDASALAALPAGPVADGVLDQLPPAATGHKPATPGSAARRRLLPWSFALGFILAAALLGGWYWLTQSRPVLSFRSTDPVLIADFDNQTGDSRFDNALRMALTVSLEQTRYASVYSRVQTENALHLMHIRPEERITTAVGREICQRENIAGLIVPGITRTGREYLLTAQLIDPANGETIHSYSQAAHSEDQILAALDSITIAIRRDLGESRYQIRQSHEPLPQVTTASFTALQAYANGEAASRSGKSDEAFKAFKAALTADPDFAMAHAAIGSIYYSFLMNEPALGEQEFRKALDLSSRTSPRERAHIEMRYAESQGRIEDALQLRRAYLQQYPNDQGVRFAYARLLRMHGHADESIPIYLDLLSKAPDLASGYIEVATAYGHLAQWPQSIHSYEKAFSLDPALITSGNVSREYGFALVQGGQEEKATRIFSALLSDPVNYAGGERSLAFLDLYHGRYAGAREHLLLALTHSTDPFSIARVRYMLAVVAEGEGDRREQIAQLDRIMSAFDALNLKILYGSLVGQAYARAGEIEKAKRLLAMIAPMVNDRVEDQAAFVQVLKAELAAATGDFPTALGFMRPPGKDDGSSSATLTRESLAHIYQQMGKHAEAMSWYQQFLGIGGSSAVDWEPQQRIFESYYTMALDYNQMGDRPNALSALDGVLVLWKDADPGLPLFRSALKLQQQIVAGH